MQLHIQRFNTELRFFTSLPQNLRDIILSFGLYVFGSVVIGVFVNTYLWREFDGLLPLLAFNFGNFIALPITFYLNGYLLGFFHIKKLYAMGAVLSGLVPLGLTLISVTELLSLAMAGFTLGIGGGLYWSNKNVLSLIVSKGSNRVYYHSIEQSILYFC